MKERRAATTFGSRPTFFYFVLTILIQTGTIGQAEAGLHRTICARSHFVMIEPSTGQHVESAESTIQEPMGVAFQGERGAFSDEAVKRYFGSEAEPFPCRSFSEVFRAVAAVDRKQHTTRPLLKKRVPVTRAAGVPREDCCCAP